MFLSRLKYAFFLVSQSHYDTAGLNYEKLRNIAAKYNIAVRYYSISRVGTLLEEEEEEEEEEEYNPKPHPNPCLAMTLTPDLPLTLTLTLSLLPFHILPYPDTAAISS